MKRWCGGKRLCKSTAQIIIQKWMAIGLCAALALSLLGNAAPSIVFAAEDSTGLCPHHESHNETCGWQPAKDGSPCTHQHNETCGYAAPTEGTPCNHVHDEACGYTEGTEEIPCNMGCTGVDADGNVQHDPQCAYTPATEGTPCTHVHDETCGYAAPTEGAPCNHVHDEACGYTEGTEGTPCAFLCEWCVTAWEWNDDLDALTWSEDAGAWGIGVPGASREQPVTREILEELLPGTVTVQTAAGPKTEEVTWDLGALPAEGAYEGDYTLTAALPAEYVLTDGVPALEVPLALGGGETYAYGTLGPGCRPGPVTQVSVGAGGKTHKFVNDWKYVVPTGGSEIENNDSGTAFVYSTTLAFQLASYDNQQLTAAITAALPSQIYCSGSNYNGLLVAAGFKSENPNPPTDGSTILGFVDINWTNVEEAVTSMSVVNGEAVLQLYAEPVSNSGYLLRVNTRDSGYKDTGNDGGVADTAEAYDILNLTVTIRDINLSNHTVTPAAPQNVTVNLFDYWVADYGKTPAAPQGDILGKSDSHFHEEGSEGAPSTTSTGYSAQSDWNWGINQGHLLLFGDGLIHAGLWNKGAGENCRYGNKYAGMEGIVKNILPESGYPEINTANAKIQMMGITNSSDPNYRNHELIKDWKLTGDHDDKSGNQYTSTSIQNLSNTVIGTWGKDIDTATESLQYLFDPDVENNYKISYEDVIGLFQLDNDGYYYYDMRKNFSEFSQEGGTNHFILYDAPATVRTDADASIGNFFPFNKGSEVFTGLSEDGTLTSSVACSRNTMNHHLGMTVDVDFRQPVNGLIGSGTNAQPMTFQFSGDDDVWVFIDDVLVLDLGGIHSEIYGTIDFQTGEVCIGRSFDTKGIPDNPKDSANLVIQTTLKQLFRDAGVDIKDSDWKGNTFASNTTHTLKMFYLERGNYDSSIALRFNLQPLLYQNVVKVDQDGSPLPGVEFELYPASRSETGGTIQCQYTDDSSVGTGSFYVTPDTSSGPLVTLTTDENGSAVFHTPEGGYFNFADLGSQYYVLRETKAPEGYRTQPVDIALHYDANTSMHSVANRWTTGAYACSVSNIIGPQQLYYAATIAANGQLESGTEQVRSEDIVDGLVVAVPLLKQRSTGSWMALYGSNLAGFGSVEASGGVTDWRGFVLRAALEQAGGDNYADWHLDWDAENTRLYGKLNDLPGLASRYLLNDPDNGDMQMVYGIIPPAVLTDLGITGTNAEERYAGLREYVKTHGVENTIAAIKSVGDGNAFRLISVDKFVRNFRSLIYIPNERRELRVLKIDQDGEPLQGTQFGLYDNASCTGTPVASGFTDQNGMLIFSPTGDNTQQGQARMVWANSANTQYYLKEMTAPSGYTVNDNKIPVVVGIYGIYADAGAADDGVRVVADVGRLTQTMRQYAMGNDVDVTLQDITAFMQVQPSGSFTPDGWNDAVLDGTDVVRSMNLHFGRNEFVDYGLHDQDGGQNFYPFFLTDTGFVRTRVQQNYAALTGQQYDTAEPNTNKDNLGNTDLTNLFSLLNMVVVTDKTAAEVQTGELTISKKVTGEVLTKEDYTKLFSFTVNLTNADGSALDGKFDYYFYGTDKAGKISNGETLLLHHDESLTILGLPAGTRFTVTETPETGWYVRPQTGSYSGEIPVDGDYNAAFTNSRQEFPHTGIGSLTIQKTVTGSGGDKTKKFDFTVSLTGNGTFTHGGVSYTLPCELSFALKDGESAVIEALPAGTTYVVTESGNEGYTVTKTGTSGMTVDGGTSTAKFVNHMDGQVPERPTDVQVTVKKVWVLDNGGQMAPSVTVVLYRNGTRHNAVELNAGNGWAYTWSGLDGSAVWTVEEPEVPDGFTSSVSKGDGLNFIITNDDISEEPPDDPDDPKKPDDQEHPSILPDPNDPGSPDEITVWEGGVPKTYIRVWDPEKNEWVYIPEGDVVAADGRPGTGDERRYILWALLGVLALTGLAAFWTVKFRDGGGLK